MKKIIGVLIIISISFLFSNIIYAWNSYKIGDNLTYKGIDFYVIEDSAGDNDIVKLLKATPLTVEEVNTYGVGHINRYTYSSIGTAYDICGNGSIGGMAYYSSESCGFENGSYVISGCTTDYKTSDVKNVIDSWASSKLDMSNIKDTRLISYSELMNNLGYSKSSLFGTTLRANSDYTPDWVYDIKAGIMTMASVGDSKEKIYKIHHMIYGTVGALVETGINDYQIAVRPVVELYKSSLEKVENNNGQDIDEKNRININDNDNKSIDTSNDNLNSETKVNVPNTMQKISIVFTMIGIILVSVSIVVIVKNKD